MVVMMKVSCDTISHHDKPRVVNYLWISQLVRQGPALGEMRLKKHCFLICGKSPKMTGSECGVKPQGPKNKPAVPK